MNTELKDEVLKDAYEFVADYEMFSACKNLKDVFLLIEELVVPKEGNEEMLKLFEQYFNERLLPWTGDDEHTPISCRATLKDLCDLDNQDLRFAHIDSYNSYNQSLPIAFQTLSFVYRDRTGDEYKEREIIAIQFHYGMDIRGGYGRFTFLEVTNLDNVSDMEKREEVWMKFVYHIYESSNSSFLFESENFFWEQPFWSECGTVEYATVKEESPLYSEELDREVESLNECHYDRYPKVFVKEYERTMGFSYEEEEKEDGEEKDDN